MPRPGPNRSCDPPNRPSSGNGLRPNRESACRQNGSPSQLHGIRTASREYAFRPQPDKPGSDHPALDEGANGRRRRPPGPPPKTSADDRTPAAARQKRFFNSESLDHARPTAGDAGPRLPPPKTSVDDRARPDGQKRKKGIPSERDTLGLLCGDAPIRPSRRQPARRFRPLRRGIRPAAPRAPSANRARAPARPWHRPAPGCPNCPCP